MNPQNKLTFDETTHSYFLDGKRLYGVTEILQKAGLVDFSFVDPDILEAARRFGSAGHKMTELWDKKILDTEILSEPLIPYLNAWKEFLKDNKIDEFQPEEIEFMVYSKLWGFAGRPDRWHEIKGKMTILDIKFTTTMNPITGIQLAAYKLAIEETYKIRIRQRWGVQLLGNGKYTLHCYKDPADETIFKSALNLTKYKEKYGK